MYRDRWSLYWFNDIKGYIGNFVAKFPNLQQVAVEFQKQGRMTQKINIHTLKWEVKNMVFISGYFILVHHDSIWMTVNRVIKFSRFLEVKTTNSRED